MSCSEPLDTRKCEHCSVVIAPKAGCRERCDPTWVARTAGWKKMQRSKQWYCYKCLIEKRLDVDVPTAAQIEKHLCTSCSEAAIARYESDVKASSQDVQPHVPPSSSALSNVPPSRAMCSPPSDPMKMKPLESFHGKYSDWLISYICRSSTEQELLARPPMGIIHYGEKKPYKRCEEKKNEEPDHWWNRQDQWQDQWWDSQDQWQDQWWDSQDQWKDQGWDSHWWHRKDQWWDSQSWWSGKSSHATEEIRNIKPGLKGKKEEYPYKNVSEEKWKQPLGNLFVKGRKANVTTSTNAETSSDSECREWRFDILEQSVKSQLLQGRPLPTSLSHMTFFQWNAGPARQRLEVGGLCGCSMHFGMMQEVDAGIVASLERWGATVHVHEKACDSPGKPTCTFARAQFLEGSGLLEADVIPRSYQQSGQTVESWLLSYSIASYRFKFPIAGREQMTLASAHLNSFFAKKHDIAIETLIGFLDTCYAQSVDMIGCDMNQAVALRKTHETSPLFEAMKQFCSKRAVASDYPYVSLFGQEKNDGCGFIIMPTSPIFAECVVVKHGWAPFLNADLGLRQPDSDAHCPNHMWLCCKTQKREYVRSPEAWDRKKKAKKGKREELKAKKKAKGTGKGKSKNLGKGKNPKQAKQFRNPPPWKQGKRHAEQLDRNMENLSNKHWSKLLRRI